MHILGTHMHIHTKYEVSILNPVARRVVHRCRHRTTTMHDGQIMITQARLVEYQMSQKVGHDIILEFFSEKVILDSTLWVSHI